MSSVGDRVSVSLQGHAGLILMRDEQRHNALCSAQVTAMLEAIEQTRRMGARAIVIASDVKSFCAGADIDEMLNGGWLTPGKTAPDAITPLKLFQVLINEKRPVITAVNGLALGGGVELVLASDLVLASEKARFAMPEIGLGVLPRTALARLSEIVGRRKALELIMTRRRFQADEAHAMGLINQVVPSTELLQAAIDMANDIAACPPGAIAAVKKNLGRLQPEDWSGLDAVLGDMDPDEWKEGFSAFVDKRPPDYGPFWSKVSQD
jgi:enoyl-CoA hydratase/carnithine racemase